ncbi:TolC family protein [Geomonas sp.]|uniref:TolC family protein n=1 Tax=Geomonas sp. TaxID=2651584 RepID=UPI002B492B08|nr:TolC family protein [Geomonas sp.]HJV36315.1 TolC family protein [Geomonas sp.]
MTRTLTAAATSSLLLALAAPLFAQQAPPINLTVNEAVKLAFERNLDLKVELFNPAIGEADIQRSLGIYDPQLNAAFNYSRSVSTNTFAFIPFHSDLFTGSAGVNQLLPTGGTIGASANSSWSSADALSYFTNGATINVSQPLLRNRGKETTELNINVARFSKEGALDRFRTRLSDTVAQVRNDYFKLYNLRENLAVQREALVLANKILDETRGRVKAGVLPAMEILSAEFGSATREKAVLDAERAVKDQMDVLRLELQLEPGRDIVPVDEPVKEMLPVAEGEAVAAALKNRPELAAQRSTVKINDLQQRAARNRTLPDLSIVANFGSVGYSRDFPHSIEHALHFEGGPLWGAGLQFSYPIGNRAAENDYIKSKLALEQSQAQLHSQESGIINDVKAAIRLLQTSYLQLDVTSRGRAYAAERLRAFRTKNSVGLATTKDVIDVENDLVSAEGNQIQAVVDYNNAITNLWHVTGVLLEKQGIKVTEQEADPLYQSAK